MTTPDDASCCAFDHHRLIARGPLAEVARAATRALDAGADGPVLVFDERSSRPIELDFRGSPADVLARLAPLGAAPAPANRGPGRPKLGVTAREVTLLPRHWDWLAQQPGGASAVLRRLVEQAQRGDAPKQRARQAMEAVDRFMNAMTGDFAGHEEASRAFYRGERGRFTLLVEHWPADVRDHLRRLVARAWDEQPP
ncbi:MAG: DUF2239 family protein [Pseudomonadota bacterium]|nr:DUF2239 family protein [Pseudomonadota bacterium]